MVFTKGLAIKALGGVGAFAAIAGTAIYLGVASTKGENKVVEVEKEEVNEVSGAEAVPKRPKIAEVEGTDEYGWLKCEEDKGEGRTCSLEKGKKMNIRVGDVKVTVEGPLPAESEDGEQTSGIIKLYRFAETTGEKYTNSHKFYIDGDIRLDSEEIPMLRNYEAYEITEENGKSYFTRKYSAGEEKGKFIGLTSDCFPPEEGEIICEKMDLEKLKNLTITGAEKNNISILAKSKKIRLKITRVEDEDIPYGYKLVFISPKDIVISKETKIIAGTNTEFHIKKNDINNLEIDRVWDIDKLAKKVGLGECSNGECKLGETINLFRKDGESVLDAKVVDYSKKKISYEENKESYNQGFKFIVNEDIELREGDIKKIDENTAYEIKEHKGNWYLYLRS